MSGLSNYEYLPQIPATDSNAREIQALTFHDVLAGGSKNPADLANPHDGDKVENQLQRLEQFPARYSGYQQQDGLLIAYMKTNEWLTGDERPFSERSLFTGSINVIVQHALNVVSIGRGDSLDPKAYGVFGIAASKELPTEERGEILYDLLARSIAKAALESAGVINVVLRDEDPAIPAALDLGFIPLGPLGEAAGAPGFLQQRYQRSVE